MVEEKKEAMETIKENNSAAGNTAENVEEAKTKPREPIAEVMGDVGKWQLQRIAIVFFIGIPGISHVFSAAFVAAKTDYWCKDNLVDKLSTNYTAETLPYGTPLNKDACGIGCKKFGFDESFWYDTLISQWDLVCEKSHLSGTIYLQEILPPHKSIHHTYKFLI